jgi:hypothetical protein
LDGTASGQMQRGMQLIPYTTLVLFCFVLSVFFAVVGKRNKNNYYALYVRGKVQLAAEWTLPLYRDIMPFILSDLVILAL